MGISLNFDVNESTMVAAMDAIQPANSPIRAMPKHMQRLVHFKELRSGKDMAYFMRRTIKMHSWSKGHSSVHLFDDAVASGNSFITYDYDLKL